MDKLFNRLNELLDRVDHIVPSVSGKAIEAQYRAYRWMQKGLGGIPVFDKDNLGGDMVEGQLHPSDSIEEKLSLSDRFGLWLSFHPFTQEQHLAVVEQTLLSRHFEFSADARAEALRFATSRGSCSGPNCLSVCCLLGQFIDTSKQFIMAVYRH
ncbi:MAG: putative AAA+ superfamily ATPase [Gammaproteobacteria bacterium]|jgi:predicted AAA+ superfamily ATPase